MRRLELLICLGVSLLPGCALAQDGLALTCHDANEVTNARSMDGSELSVFATVTKNAFRKADAARAGEGQPTFMQDWTDDRLIGEVIAVVVSCRKHPADTINQRSTAIFNEYVILHSQ